MQIKLDKHLRKFGIRTQVRIVEGYRPGPGLPPKQRTLENLGYLEDQENPDLFLQHLRDRVAATNHTKTFTFTVDLSMKNSDAKNIKRNYGYQFIQYFYDLLKIDEFLNDHRTSKAHYDLNEILQLLIFMRIIDPDSKRATFMKKGTLYQKDLDLNLEHIYRSLDELGEMKMDLELHLSEQIAKLVNTEDMVHTYLDVTNYYFEKDFAEAGRLGQKGVSKEHQLTPIVQMGLILNNLGLPIISELFAGNTSDTLILQPMIENLIQRGISERLVVVADKGLNSSTNIDYLCNLGNGYVFSQIVRGTKGKRYYDEMFQEEGYVVNADGSYKYKLITERYPGIDGDGKKIQRQRQVLMYWSKAEAEMARKKREVKIARAEKALKNNACFIDHSKQEYLKEEIVGKETGEVLEMEKVYSLNEDKICQEAKLDGYFCLVTSEMDYDERKIREVYSNLWKIEQSFRITKSDLEARPIYLNRDIRIRAHFLLCHIALLILRMIQMAMKEEAISAERIKTVLQQCCLDIPANGILHLNEVGGKAAFESYLDTDGQLAYKLKENGKDEIAEDFRLIQQVFNIDLDRSYIKQEVFNRMMKKATVALQ